MSLIQQTITCPWQPRLRKALPAGFGSNGSNGSNSSIGSNGSNSGRNGTSTLLSELRALLDTTPAQQHEQEARLLQALCSVDCRPPGVLLSSCVLGGYLWQVFLVGAPYRHPSQIITGDPEAVAAEVAARAAAAKAAAAAGCTRAQQPQRQQLAVRVICRPAWAANLDSSSSSSSTARTPCAGASALGRYEGLPFCAAFDSDESGLLAEAAAAAAAAGEPGSTCGVCKSLCSIAASKAAAAADRHLPFGGAFDLSDSRDVIVGVNVTAAPSAALLQALQGQVAAKPPAEAYTTVRLRWSLSLNTAYGLVPLDVFGIQAASDNLVTEWACSDRELPAHAAHPLVPAAVFPVDQDPEVAAGAAAAAGAAGGGAGAPDGSLAVGWQPELWSRLAYTGELHWLCRLRLLSD
jgi:hypothetical protein